MNIEQQTCHQWTRIEQWLQRHYPMALEHAYGPVCVEEQAAAEREI